MTLHFRTIAFLGAGECSPVWLKFPFRDGKRRARTHAQKMGSFFERPPRPARLWRYFFESDRISFFPSEFVWARFLFSFVRFRVSASKISGTPFPNLLARRHLVSSKIVPPPESGCLDKVGPHGDHNRRPNRPRGMRKRRPLGLPKRPPRAC